jgi:hypothetical protein
MCCRSPLRRPQDVPDARPFRISFCVHVPMIAEDSCRVEWLESGRQLLPVRPLKHWICNPPGLIASVWAHEAGCRISLSRPGQRTRRIRAWDRYVTLFDLD